MPDLPPLRVAHLADTHLGYRQYAKLDPESDRNQRSVDIERAFTAAIDAILAAAPDLVIHAGDVFHHTRPTWPAMRVFVQQMRRLEQAGIPVVVIAGNHDVPRVRTAGTVYSLLEIALPGVHFVAGYESQRVGFKQHGLVVAAIPHGAISLDAAGPAAYPAPGYRNILVAHGVIPGMADLTHVEPGEEEISDALLDTGFDYIALGHIHAFQHVRANTWYSGATERTGWGEEAATPGWALVEFPAGAGLPTVTHHPTPARPMHTLPPFAAGDLAPRAIADHILERAGRLGDPEAMVRIELRDITRGIRREVEAIVKRESAPVAWQIDIRQPGGVGAFLGERPTAASDTIDPLALFDTFVTERADAGIYDTRFAAAFRDRGRAALERAAQDELQQSAEVAE
jgi:exonuclease SbcD